MSEQQFTAIQLFRTLVVYRATITLCAVAGLSLALLAGFLITPTYRSETLLSFNEDQISESGLSALASQFSGLSSIAGIGLGGMAGDRNAALALLTSRGFLEDFLVQRDLLPVLFERRWDSRVGQWADSRWFEPPTVADGVRLLRDRVLRVSEDRRTGLIRITVEWRDPEVAAEWANDLVRRANDVTRGWAIDEARESQKYLRLELDKTNVLELRESVNRLIEAELKKEMVASVRVQYSFRVIDEAKPSDPHDFVKPQRLFLGFLGLMMGFGVGVLLALVVHSVRHRA